MDASMRDLERIQEREGTSGRKLMTLLMAALATVGLVFAMGVLLGSSSDAEADEAADPLGALEDMQELAPGDQEGPEAAPEVEREALTFPGALGDYDSRPEVEAALAAAGAELDHPEPLPAGMAAGDFAAGLPMDDTLHSSLPAAVTAGPSGELLAQAMERDPMVAAALPPEPDRELAAPGRDGVYTLQVISYQNPTDAEVFASGLRARGHHAFVVAADVPGRGMHWRVRVGPFETMREAEAYRAEFENRERMNTIVVRRRDE